MRVWIESRGDRRVWPLLASLLLASFLACGDDPGPETTPPPIRYGTLVTPRLSMDADPLLADAYQHVGADGYAVGHFSISWPSIAVGPEIRDWRGVDRHVQRAAQKGLRLSVVVEILHGGEPESPEWLFPLFPGWEHPTLRREFQEFLIELAERTEGTIAWLWLGEGPERYAVGYPGEEAGLVSFLGAMRREARTHFPGAQVGILVAPEEVARLGQEPWIEALRDSLDLLGLSVMTEVESGIAPPPSLALARFEDRVSRWADRPFAILETGFPSDARLGSSEALQAEFAAGLIGWLRRRPDALKLVCWAPLHDPDESIADSLSRRRHPLDPDRREAFRLRIATAGLRRNDGSPKIGRQVFYEERP